MKIEITYIFHNCFVVRIADKAILFDFPGDEYLDDDIRNEVLTRVGGTQLFVFSSHFHSDHFNRNIADIDWPSQTTTFILSKDIVKKNRRFREMDACQTVGPNQTYKINGMGIETFLSNDEGVAYLIHIEGANIYFGGDLANWAWEDNTKQEKMFLEDHFGEVLNKVKQYPIHIGFSNSDARLKNWSGAWQFVDTVKPRLFVPMHTFGKTESLSRYMAQNPGLKTPLFIYEKYGDSISMDLP